MTRTVELEDGLVLRPYEGGDTTAVLALLADSLGWAPTDPGADLFAWKHQQNPFGASPAWVAAEADQVIGFRTFMRWRFTFGGQSLRTVRAVDTATHSAYRGRRIFSRLTTHAVAELTAAGEDFVFNTPNDRSRPGYLKLGWQPVGRLSAALLPRRPRSLPVMLRARVPAKRWSEPTAAGVPAGDALADEAAVARLLSAVGRPDQLTTARSGDYLRWRYGLEPMHYRALRAGSTAADGLLLFRVRRRGEARELVVADLLLPPERLRKGLRLVREALDQSRADYAIGLTSAVPAGALVPVPGQGPLLVRRPLRTDLDLPVRRWGLSLGDVELF